MKKVLFASLLLLLIVMIIPTISIKAETGDMGNGDLFYHWSNEEGVQDTKISTNSSETYTETDRKWQGIPAVHLTKGGRLWCAIQTGDEGENGNVYLDNYDVMYYSDDYGKTWSENYLIFNCREESIRLTGPTLFEDQFGKLWLVLVRGGGNGTYAIEMKNPDCDNPEEELEFGKPISWLKFPPAHKPTILSNGRWITPIEATIKNQQTYICNPNNETGVYSWKSITQTPAASSFENKNCAEAQILELLDGSLMMLSRLPGSTGGGMEISYSDDFGANWTPYKAFNGEPYQTPGSKFYIARLDSGNVMLITHATTESRTKLCVYLSTDDCKTWPYKMMLDDSDVRNKWGVSYPDASQRQGEHGEIYIVYDAGRYDQKEIRLSIITEEDIMAGHPVSEYASLRNIVNKPSEYKTYVSVKESFEKYYYVPLGTTKDTILNTLPTSLTLVGEDNTELSLTGTWRSSGYISTVKGTYTASFSFNESMPGLYEDRYSLLNVYIIVGEEKEEPTEPEGNKTTVIPTTTTEPTQDKGGCKGSLSISLICSIVLLMGSLIIVKKKNRNR